MFTARAQAQRRGDGLNGKEEHRIHCQYHDSWYQFGFLIHEEKAVYLSRVNTRMHHFAAMGSLESISTQIYILGSQATITCFLDNCCRLDPVLKVEPERRRIAHAERNIISARVNSYFT